MDNQLIRCVKENSMAFSRIVQEAIQAGEDDQGIMERLTKYVESLSPKASLPDSVLTNPSGYIDYFRNKR